MSRSTTKCINVECASVIHMNDTLTVGQKRTLRAREARKHDKNLKIAERLRDAGWTVIPPNADTK